MTPPSQKANRIRSFYFMMALCTILVGACALPVTPGASQDHIAPAAEHPVTVIPLQGPLASRQAELSGLAWYGDALILLPQYPNRFENQLFYLEKQAFVDFLQGVSQEPLTPQPLPLILDDLPTRIDGFEGFEAIAFSGDRAFLTIEADVEDQMMGYLVAGVIAPDLSELRLETQQVATITPQSGWPGLTDEAILVAGGEVITLYEGNGLLVNLAPKAHRFQPDTLQPLGTHRLAHLDYRITDVTALDAANRFWAVNIYYPVRNAPQLGPDALATRYGLGDTHRMRSWVERLVEFEYTPEGVTLAESPPLQLQLLDETSRNWEGIARLQSDAGIDGFLLVTDGRPATLLAFVAAPQTSAVPAQ